MPPPALVLFGKTMRNALLLLALAGLALAAPLGQGQAAAQSSVVLAITPPEEALTAETTRLLLHGTVSFTGDPTHFLSLSGIPVEYAITRIPAWLTAVASPSNDVIPVHQPGANGQAQGARSFTLSVHLAHEPTQSLVDVIEVTATVRPQSPGAMAKSVAAAVPVSVYVPAKEEPCPEHLNATYVTAAPPQTDAETAPAPAPEEDPLIVQSGGVTPVSTWYAIGGFGLAGAGAGFALWRRRSR